MEEDPEEVRRLDRAQHPGVLVDDRGGPLMDVT